MPYSIDAVQRRQPDLWELSQLLEIHSRDTHGAARPPQRPDDLYLGIYVAAHYRGIINSSNQWHSTTALGLIRDEQRKFAERSVFQYSEPTAQELSEASNSVRPLLVEAKMASKLMSGTQVPLTTLGISLLMFVALPAFITALLFRGGLLFWGLRVAIVRADGSQRHGSGFAGAPS